MKALISKLGASGDVVRTTVLLGELSKKYNEIYWLTSEYNKDLLKSKKITKVFLFENEKDKNELKNIEFDLLLSLDEDIEPLTFLKEIKYKKLIGHFLNPELPCGIDYTPECDYWLDMSFISKKYERIEADEFKLQNKKSVPQIWMEMIFGENSWKEQEYDLGIKPKPIEEVKGRIGIIDISESKWPNKLWSGHKELKSKLNKEGYEVISLGMKDSLKEHIDDINNVETVICGDTSGMHIALALKKKVVAIFNCTPPNEIYDYGRMKKVVSPLLEQYYLKRTDDKEAQNAISVEEVYDELKEILS